MSSTKGDRNERELVNLLRDEGWRVLRVPASGSATDEDLPDILAGSSEHDLTVAIEAKRSGGDNIYLPQSECEALIRFAIDFGAIPVASGRWDRDTKQYIVPVDNAPRTKSGSLRLSHQAVQTNGRLTATYLQEIEQYTPDVNVCPRCDTVRPRTDPVSRSGAYKHGYTQLCSRCLETLNAGLSENE